MKIFFGIVFFLASILFAIGIFATSRIELVAKDTLGVDRYPVPEQTPVAWLQNGERATVLSCDDLKSYPAVHVRLPNGTEGYVIEDKYELVRRSVWERPNSGPVVFLCP